MKLIDALTSDANQSVSVVLDDGTKVDLTFNYKESQQGWFYTLVYGAVLTINNRRLVNSPNMLRQFRGILPFGIACIVNDGLEPVYIDDLSNGRVSVYIMNPTDVATVEDTTIPGYADA